MKTYKLQGHLLILQSTHTRTHTHTLKEQRSYATMARWENLKPCTTSEIRCSATLHKVIVTKGDK